MKPKLTGYFKMKARTMDGDCARYFVRHFDNETILIEKYILSRHDLTTAGFHPYIGGRRFFGKTVWRQGMSFKDNTLFNIAHHTYKMATKQ